MMHATTAKRFRGLRKLFSNTGNRKRIIADPASSPPRLPAPSSSTTWRKKRSVTASLMLGSFHWSRMVQSSFSLLQFANSRTQHLASSPWVSAGRKSWDGKDLQVFQRPVCLSAPLVSDESVMSCHAAAQFAGSLQRYSVWFEGEIAHVSLGSAYRAAYVQYMAYSLHVMKTFKCTVLV